MTDSGFILLSRSILDSEVFANPRMLKVWIWCLLKANHTDRFVSVKVGKGCSSVKVARGQFIFGRNKAESELDIDGATISRYIDKFKDMSMISKKVSNQYTLITICNYGIYQDVANYQRATNEQPMSNQRATNEQQMSTNNNDNNDNNYKSIYIGKPKNFEEVESYAKERFYDIEDAKSFFLYFESQNWINSNGNSITNWKTRLDLWIRDSNVKKSTDKQPKTNNGVKLFRNSDQDYTNKSTKIE